MSENGEPPRDRCPFRKVLIPLQDTEWDKVEAEGARQGQDIADFLACAALRQAGAFDNLVAPRPSPTADALRAAYRLTPADRAFMRELRIRLD